MDEQPGQDETVAGEPAAALAAGTVDAPTSQLPPDLRRRPLWTYFLTPIAVVIGAAIIAGAVWCTSGNDDGNRTSSPAPTQAAAAESTAPGATAKTQQDLLSVFNGYVAQLGMDQAKFSACLGNKDTATVINNQLQRGAKLGITGTPTFIINNKMLVGAQPAQVFDEIVQAELKGSPTSLSAYSQAVQQLAQQNPPYFKILDSRPDVSDAQVQGNPNAKVMIAEFSDFQCPFCKQWTDQNVARIRGELGDNIAFAFLNFPITQIHPNAGNAALVAQCAAEQGKFWPMHDLLFSRQAEWSSLVARNQ